MNLLSADTTLLAGILFLANFIIVLLINTEERFWIPTMILWITLFCAFLIVRTLNSDRIRNEELILQQSKNSEDDKANANWKIENSKQETARVNEKLFILLGCQTFYCFFFHLIGYAKTRRDYYRKSTITFFILSLVSLILAVFT